jgi:hypothetical protein
MSRTPCAICGGALERELLRISFPDRFERHVGIAVEGYSRSWMECVSCGAATNVHMPVNRGRLDALAAGYYEVDFAGSSIGEKYAKVMALPARLSDNAQRVERIHAFMDRWLPPAGRPATVVDIGAGTGVFLSRFLESASGRPWRGHAIEPDAAAARHLRSLARFTVTEGLFSRELGLSGVQLITLNKVLEHVPDPVALLREAVSALDESGIIYVELPDKLTVHHRPPTDNILGALHCHLYDPVSIAVVLGRAGLAPLRVERLFEPSGKISVAAFAAAGIGIRRLAEQGAAQ